MRTSPVSALLIICTLAVTAEARAQGNEPLGFRAGQWGADFQVLGGFTGAGAIKFTSPTSAWILDLGNSVVHASGTFPGMSGTATGTSINVSIKAGRRMYRAISHNVAPSATLGMTATYFWQRATEADTALGHSNGIGAGLFGSLGATWLITPHLGVGAQWSLAFNYMHQSFTSNRSGTSKTNTITVSLPNMALAGQLYF
jgi:hypothetical protein